VLSDSSGARSKGGRLFQVAGPNTAKLHWPVEVRTLGKRRVPVMSVLDTADIDVFFASFMFLCFCHGAGGFSFWGCPCKHP